MSSLSESSILAGAAGGAADTTYTIDQSIRFNDNDSPALKKTYSGAGTEETFTFSCWVKRGNTGASLGGTGNYGLTLFSGGPSVSNYGEIVFRSSGYGVQDSLDFYYSKSGSISADLVTTRLFRDTTAWYHIVCVMDTTNVVPSERMRIYVNGARETSFSTETYPSKDAVPDFNTASEHGVGVFAVSTDTRHFDGYLAEIHFLDGYAYGPEFFGELEENGIWIPKEYTGSYGTNGFKIDGRDSNDLGDDESGQNNDYAATGLAAHDKVPDSPTNNFCTAFPRGVGNATGVTFADGNLDCSTSGTAANAPASISLDSGKWYYEINFHAVGSGINAGAGETPDGSYHHFALGSGGNQINTNGEDRSFSSDGSGTIAGFKLDIDSGTLEYTTNGTSYSVVEGSLTAGTAYAPYMRIGSGSGRGVFNFGQDSTFGGLETAGSKSDDNGVGDFYYNVPSGFLAICTKNLGS